MSTQAVNQSDLAHVLDSAKSTLFTRGISVTPYTNQSLGQCSAAPGVPEKVVATLSAMQELLGNVTKSSKSEIDFEQNLLKQFCNSIGFKYPRGFADLIHAGDVVEIYNGADNVQVFRNFSFLKHCTYDLLTLLSHPFPELFDREERVTEAVLLRASEVWQAAEGPQPWRIPPHVVTEKRSQLRSKFMMTPKFVAPVFMSDGTRFGWASSLTVSPLGSWIDNLENVHRLKR